MNWTTQAHHQSYNSSTPTEIGSRSIGSNCDKIIISAQCISQIANKANVPIVIIVNNRNVNLILLPALKQTTTNTTTTRKIPHIITPQRASLQ
jgi:hypothetical protein